MLLVMSQEKYLERFGISLRTVDPSPEQFTARHTTHPLSHNEDWKFFWNANSINLLKRIEEIIDRNYRDLSGNSIAPVALDNVSNFLENDEQDIFEGAIRFKIN